jgi:4-diphosphocytidyl-2-C-methyl-D-erythritol kinase
MRLSEPAPAKLNLALHVRSKRTDGRHAIETVFAFCIDGDLVDAEPADAFSLEVRGPFAAGLSDGDDNLVVRAARLLAGAARIEPRTSLILTKNLPIASGIGGGSADAAAALRLLTRMWGLNPKWAVEVAGEVGSDVPACLLNLTARGTGAGDQLELVQDPGISGTPVLLVNPRIELSTADAFAAWDGLDRGPLGEWREGRNDLEAPARTLVPQVGDILDWLKKQPGANFVRMSGSGATCFALFDRDDQRDVTATACPPNWWHLATFLR